MRFEAKPTNKLKLAIYIAVAFVLSYLLASLAINSGSIIAYTLTSLSVLYGLYYLVRLVRLSIKKSNLKEEKRK